MGPACAVLLRLLLVLISCQGEPERVEDCARLSDATGRENCRFSFVERAMDDSEALDAILAEIESSASRDLVLLRLSIAHPQRASRFCERVETEGAQEKCRQVLGRPHLQSAPRPPKEQP